MTTSTPDLTGYNTVHAALRAAPHRLAAAARSLDPADAARSRAISRYWHGYAGEVHAHHTVEDDYFFPALVAKVPSTRDLIGRTDVEHHELDGLMAATDAEVARVAAGARDDTDVLVERFDALTDLMDRHLDFEDREILPVFQSSFGAEEYAAIDANAVKTLPFRQAFFTVPFIGWSAPKENWAQMLAHAPAPMRVVWRLTKNSHAHLMEVAFAGDAGVQAAIHEAVAA
jgi:hemerythrin-like domain-containing protein